AAIESSPEAIHALHGTTATGRCLNRACLHRGNPREWSPNSDGVPMCPVCGGPTRPDVVLFGEGLDPAVYSAAEAAVQTCAVVVLVGTSLEVTPAANIALDAVYQGTPIHWINPAPPPPSVECSDKLADHRGTADDVLPSLLEVSG
ncbi:MAG: Sir2 family NAD-dependent protein deacetylase, partial [Actinomycetes bacterium]